MRDKNSLMLHSRMRTVSSSRTTPLCSVDLECRGWVAEEEEEAFWSEASECDVFIGLLLSDCLIRLPAHCLCQLLFKGISLQVQLRRGEPCALDMFFFFFFFYLVFICHVCWLSLWGWGPRSRILSQRGNKNSRCSSAFEAWGREKKTSSYTNTLWC